SVLFPQPDSPRIPTISPERTSRLTPSKARIGSPSSGEYVTDSSRTCATYALEVFTRQQPHWSDLTHNGSASNCLLRSGMQCTLPERSHWYLRLPHYCENAFNFRFFLYDDRLGSAPKAGRALGES